MNKVLLIATASLLAMAWAVRVQILDNSRYEFQDNPPALPFLTPVKADVVTTRAPHNGADKYSFATYLQCRQYIDRNYQRLTSLQQVAQECHLNVGHMVAMFEQYGHQHPNQYLLRLKKNHPAGLLQQKTGSVTAKQDASWPAASLASR
ncbi:MAG TPA: hypothetical protein VMR33_05510 [Candidatus Baltobacteraceae bacterium]|jgi:hypothetical protein|nr:hypothetical protein [Candidatus Baltobacteraceae bacterium]